jgi:sigma-B regulation protein RsbU (phosphoserine phosphatase)
MEQNNINIFRSISGRITIQVLLVCALLFIVTFIFFFEMSVKKVEDETVMHAHSELNSTISQIENILSSVEVAVENFVWQVEEHLQDPESMFEMTKMMLSTNDFISGSAIAFEPYYFKDKGLYFSPYSYTDKDGNIQTKLLGGFDYDYHHMDWYQIPHLLKKPYWTEPYYDVGGGEMMMTTYSVPIFDKDGNQYAVITADISLHWLTDLVNDIHAFPNSLNLMVSRAASFLVHPETEKILNETIFTIEYEKPDEQITKMQDDIVEGRAGEIVLIKNSEKYFMFYSPVKTTDWTVVIYCPFNEVFAGVRKLKYTVSFLVVIALLLMLLICYRSIRKITDPIKEFAAAAVEIARGDFNVTLPKIKIKDELFVLSKSFSFMQESLNNYIDELKNTTAKKERIESELRIASEIQMGMIPKMFPAFPERDDLDLFAKLTPAKEVGGDLYDFFIDNEKLYFIVGDVSGKGVPASLVMAVTCRLFRTITSHFKTPEEIMNSLNNALSENNDSNMFCTAFVGILDLQTGNLLYCNAGHNAPVHISDNVASFIDVKPNLPLGLFSGFPYEGQSMTLAKGDGFYIYTDGVTEAEDRSKELYSDEKLLELIRRCMTLRSKDIVEESFADLARHADGADQSDDITVLHFKYR